MIKYHEVKNNLILEPKKLGFEPEYQIQEGIVKAMPWYINFLENK